jgi:hypothetical protein
LHLRNALENSGAKILNRMNSLRNMLKESPRMNFIPLKFKQLLGGETLGEGPLYGKTVTVYMSLFHTRFSVMCFKWEMSSFLVR